MGELRRLLIEPGRLAQVRNGDGRLPLTADESHYIKRVLRRRTGDRLLITDGCGLLWEAVVVDGEGLQLNDSPCEREPEPVRPLVLRWPSPDEDLTTRCEWPVSWGSTPYSR